MAVKTYDPKEVSVIVNGNIIGGFGEGSMVRVNRREDAFALTIGVTGEGTRSKSNDRSASIEIELLQSSLSNDVLSGLATADDVSNTGAVPIEVRDHNGTSIYSAETAWVMKIADSEFGAEATNRVWTLETDSLQVHVGGI